MAALEILIVTTRQSRRWIVPKGWPIKRLTPSKSAAREAFEEAGVRGKIGARAIGNFRYNKTGQNGADPDCEVKIFPLLVRRQSATWPEHGQRVVQWVDPEKAISLIREPALTEVTPSISLRRSASRATDFAPRPSTRSVTMPLGGEVQSPPMASSGLKASWPV